MSAVEQVYPSLLAAAHGLDTSWWERAACHAWIRRDYVPTPWNVSSSDKPVNGVPCHKLVDLALIICAACPARFDCARYAVDGRMIAGTWAMRVKLLLWLQKQGDAHGIINAAEAAGEDVQVFVRAVRRERDGADD